MFDQCKYIVDEKILFYEKKNHAESCDIGTTGGNPFNLSKQFILLFKIVFFIVSFHEGKIRKYYFSFAIE